MSTLRNRTRPEFYAELAASLRTAGLTDADVEEEIARHVQEAKTLLDGKCPKCGEPIARYVNYREAVVPPPPGVWVQYRCSTAPPPGRSRGSACDFMVDLRESLEEN